MLVSVHNPYGLFANMKIRGFGIAFVNQHFAVLTSALSRGSPLCLHQASVRAIHVLAYMPTVEGCGHLHEIALLLHPDVELLLLGVPHPRGSHGRAQQGQQPALPCGEDGEEGTCAAQGRCIWRDWHPLRPRLRIDPGDSLAGGLTVSGESLGNTMIRT